MYRAISTIVIPVALFAALWFGLIDPMVGEFTKAVEQATSRIEQVR